jgi:hypothetical protein
VGRAWEALGFRPLNLFIFLPVFTEFNQTKFICPIIFYVFLRKVLRRKADSRNAVLQLFQGDNFGAVGYGFEKTIKKIHL